LLSQGTVPAPSLLRCRGDVPKMTGFSSGGFGASSGHVSKREAGEAEECRQEKTGRELWATRFYKGFN